VARVEIGAEEHGAHVDDEKRVGDVDPIIDSRPGMRQLALEHLQISGGGGGRVSVHESEVRKVKLLPSFSFCE
jgi:hypothetical protein